MSDVLLPLALLVWGFVTLCFVISLIIKRNDIADVAWGIGIPLIALFAYREGAGEWLSLVVTTVIMIWGVRLALHIGLRNLKKHEDCRYAAWREAWGKWFYVRSYLQVFLLQGFLMMVVAYPAVHVIFYSSAISMFVYVGVCVWIVGFVFETIGDYQLTRFIADPENRGRIMTSGLWNYTRHPNYFGEITQWWGVWLMVVTTSYGLIALVSPLMITFLILKVSGIPMLERQFAGNPEFEAYKARTNAFFPWFPRKSSVF